MSATTAFDVAGSVLERAQNQSLSPLKLQKLVFYSFGWFAHLTSEKLFSERFFAMSYGPVVSPLLDAHAGRNDVSKDELEAHQGRTLRVPDYYMDEVVDAVWSSYGRYSHSDLIEMTHCETPWDVAYNKRRPTFSKRSDLSSDELVRHFVGKTSAVYQFNGRTLRLPVLGLLPDRQRTYVKSSDLWETDSAPSQIPDEHLMRADELRRRFMSA